MAGKPADPSMLANIPQLVRDYYVIQPGGAPVRLPMKRAARPSGSGSAFTFTARVPATRPAADYTPRLIPHLSGASVPLEAALILWYDGPKWG